MKILENILLAKYTTLKVGGPAKFFCEAKDEEEILEAVRFAEEKKMPVFILGGGSNILISDKGFDGLVIKLQNTSYSLRPAGIDCSAGCQLSTIVGESVKAGLAGLEWAAGIPGTIGGAVRGNAGAFGGEIGDVVENIKVLDILGNEINKRDSDQIFNFQFSILKKEDCKFIYRGSIFKDDPNLIILSVNLKLNKADKNEIEKRVKEIINIRKEKQPFDFPSSGSFFKNPVIKKESIIKEYEEDTGSKAKNEIIPAGYLIDRLNLRGKKIGGAMVSQEHGNFLVNAGNAKAEDFIILISLIKQKIRVHFGVQLTEEVQLVGF